MLLLLADNLINPGPFGLMAFLVSIALALVAASVLAGRKHRRRKPRPRPERPLW